MNIKDIVPEHAELHDDDDDTKEEDYFKEGHVDSECMVRCIAHIE